MSMKLEGFRELDQALGELTKATGRNVMHRALRDAAEPMARAMRQGAPRQDDQLYESIDVSTKVKNEAGKAAYHGVMKAGGSKEAAVAALKDARSGRSFFEIYVGPSVEAPHSHLQEFGTMYHSPHPFVRPAWDAEAAPTVDRLKVSLAEEINNAAARAARKAARQRATSTGR